MANSPFGTYAAEGIITVTFPKITDLLKVPFTLELDKTAFSSFDLRRAVLII